MFWNARICKDFFRFFFVRGSKYWSIFPSQPNIFFYFKIILFGPISFQKHILLFKFLLICYVIGGGLRAFADMSTKNISFFYVLHLRTLSVYLKLYVVDDKVSVLLDHEPDVIVVGGPRRVRPAHLNGRHPTLKMEINNQLSSRSPKAVHHSF